LVSRSGQVVLAEGVRDGDASAALEEVAGLSMNLVLLGGRVGLVRQFVPVLWPTT